MNKLTEKIINELKPTFESEIKYGAVTSLEFDLIVEIVIEKTAKEIFSEIEKNFEFLNQTKNFKKGWLYLTKGKWTKLKRKFYDKTRV